MLDMPATEPSRLLLFTDSPRTTAPVQPTKVRRYRLARLQPDGPRRDESAPRYEYLKRSYD